MSQHSLAGNRRLKKDALTRVQLVVLAFRERKLCGSQSHLMIRSLLAPRPLQYSAVLHTSGLKSHASSLV